MKRKIESESGAGRLPDAKRSLGQHFLVDKGVARRIVDALGVEPGGNVLEIGPGAGALCGHVLALDPGRYLALEKDRDLAAALEESRPGMEVRAADALAFAWEGLDPGDGWRVLGNLPYNVASPIIWEFASRAAYSRAVFMVQLEVAERLVSPPGRKSYGALGVWVGNFARARLCFKVGPGAFRPRPKVDSGVVSLEPLPPGERAEDPGALSSIVKMCFQMRRKQLRTILKECWGDALENWFETNGLDPRLRPENLSPREFARLGLVVKTLFSP